MYLVKFSCDWADEFDVYGHTILPEKEWEEFVEKVEDLFSKVDVVYTNFGSNEGFEWKSATEFLRCFEVNPVDEFTANTIKALFGSTWGFVPIDQILEDYE